MDIQQINQGQVGNSLRTSSADFFIMELPRSSSKKVLKDRSPLRRCLRLSQPVQPWEGNENTCYAMWELMARS